MKRTRVQRRRVRKTMTRRKHTVTRHRKKTGGTPPLAITDHSGEAFFPKKNGSFGNKIIKQGDSRYRFGVVDEAVVETKN
jgi:hypothetical protein